MTKFLDIYFTYSVQNTDRETTKVFDCLAKYSLKSDDSYHRRTFVKKNKTVRESLSEGSFSPSQWAVYKIIHWHRSQFAQPYRPTTRHCRQTHDTQPTDLAKRLSFYGAEIWTCAAARLWSVIASWRVFVDAAAETSSASWISRRVATTIVPDSDRAFLHAPLHSAEIIQSLSQSLLLQ